jgi:hypothetical protein
MKQRKEWQSMPDYHLNQLLTILLLQRLYESKVRWEKQIVMKRIYELDEEYAKTEEYQDFSAEQEQLFQALLESNDKKIRRDTLIEFDSANGGELLAVKKFFYLAGLNDAMRMFNSSI